MNPFEMVVGIVLIVTFGSVLRAMFHGRGRRVRIADDPEAGRMKEEIRTLRDRVAVLERIATDKHQLLEQEFERLRED
jgi:hypothetical protein